MSDHPTTDQQATATGPVSSIDEITPNNVIAQNSRKLFIPERRDIPQIQEGNPDNKSRPVFVKTRPLRQLAEKSGYQGAVVGSVSSVPVTGHWALEVGAYTYELLFPDGDSKFFCGEWDSVVPPGQVDSVKRLKIGDCKMSDEQIHQQAKEVFERVTYREYHKFTNNCQRYVRILSCKLCADTVTDWLATNFIFLTRRTPSSTLITESSWVGMHGVVALAHSTVGIFAHITLATLATNPHVLVGVGLGLVVCFAGYCFISFTVTPWKEVVSNYYKKTKQKIDWGHDVSKEEYTQKFGDRNPQLEALDAAMAMIIGGKDGRAFARNWFNIVRPDELNTYSSLLDVVSGQKAQNSHQFVDWMTKATANTVGNERKALATRIRKLRPALKEKVTIENTKKVAKLVGKSMNPRRHSQESPTTDFSNVPRTEAIPASELFPETQGRDIKGDQDDVQGLQAVIVRRRAAEETGGETSEEDCDFGDVIHVGDPGLLQEWLRLQREDSED